LDAAALPWRTHLRGPDVGTRWVELAGRYEEGDEGGFYAFNDMHAMMAFIATGRSAAAVARLAAMEAAAEGEGTAGRCTHEPQRCN
ncbi:MAG: tetratricopeptide repeat protein, partial [Gammaproteobacteria bacterium]|nr:tetratricopeptide repeat protein [Gammaproteobacteria bacterium]NIR85418.1 tetratricopeptide repeat protein [Gammaproteobacteria bacterium]NIR89307.1 tetratricopeptide repeat protein [Gammaproteobacteria bacterium]NIU06558.1 tetratricopeptide repeat protein [Gammaproteobacteria bacterium]NIV53447.1 tetratricopeptide repeat protein [Gammaproteobacteria bacterium]